MSWTIKTLDLGLVELNRRRMISNAGGNGLVQVPVQGWLLMRGNDAIVIDTGFRHPDILKRLGDSAAGIERPDQRLAYQLAIHGVEPRDVRYVFTFCAVQPTNAARPDQGLLWRLRQVWALGFAQALGL